MKWFDKAFEQLTVNELFAILKLRAQVFNTEQHSDYCDPDDQDPKARHVFAVDDGQLVAYARYFQIGNQVTFGRVVVAKSYRGKGLGNQLIKQLLKGIAAVYPQLPITIHAQTYVREMYAKFGFTTTGKEFIEADRKHYKMTHRALG